MLANRPRGTIYIGVTSDHVVRIWQHRNADVDGFTKRHRIHDLVWYERHERMDSAISRETSLKAWRRLWKLQLIESANPQWRDLYPDIIR
jgi:putative endonuclease